MGLSWLVNETSSKGNGRWTSLYCALDRDGNRVEVLRSETRDRAAAAMFFESPRTGIGSVPTKVPSDGPDSYPGALKVALGEAVQPRTNRSLNNQLEQDH